LHGIFACGLGLQTASGSRSKIRRTCFDRCRADQARSRARAGARSGLSLAHSIGTAHGGSNRDRKPTRRLRVFLRLALESLSRPNLYTKYSGLVKASVQPSVVAFFGTQSSPSAVDGYQRSSTASSPSGPHRRLIASTAQHSPFCCGAGYRRLKVRRLRAWAQRDLQQFRNAPGSAPKPGSRNRPWSALRDHRSAWVGHLAAQGRSDSRQIRPTPE
jgi:hypothetical protein